MIFEYKYRGFSQVASTPRSTEMSFVPDANRDPLWFQGQLNEKLPFREAISALHQVVTSDLRLQIKDRSEYKLWAQQQEEVWLAEYMEGSIANKARLEEVRQEYEALREQKHQAMKPFYDARQKYFDHIYRFDRLLWIVLDPIISVHPDEIFFECFSQDESSYGRLSCSHEVFNTMGDFRCGTTNIDYSRALYDEFSRIRNYKTTELKIDPEGFEVATGEDYSLREEKIDVPDSWARGFLQVSSAMTLEGTHLTLDPMDFHAICFHLKRRKEKKGPRSLRFKLVPGQPPVITVDPWGIDIVCRRSQHEATEATEIRIWGRRRLLILERMIPVAQKIRVKLLGYGLPSFWQVEMGLMKFTLGLSGWTANDWSKAGQFDLLAPRAKVSAETVQRVLGQLNQDWSASSQSLANQLGLENKDVLAALVTGTQAGIVVRDLNDDLWRSRALSKEPLPLSKLRFANERESLAQELIAAGAVSTQVETRLHGRRITGTVKDRDKTYDVDLEIDGDERLVKAKCTCNFFSQNKLRQGPCEHILAARLAQTPPLLPSR